MANGKQPVFTGIIQSTEKDYKKRKNLGRIVLWNYEGKKKEGEEDSLFEK